MEIKWKEFLLQEFPKGEIIHGKHGKELNIDCISPDCPSPKDHMFVNMGSDNPKHDKRFICHRCGVSGNHKAFLTIYYALPYDEVVKNYQDLYGGDTDHFTEATSSLKTISAEGILGLDDKETEEGLIIDTPREYRTLTHQTKFCKRRFLPISMIRKFNVGICKGGFYDNRLIFPIQTKNNRSFLAYSQYKKTTIIRYKRLRKKYPDDRKIKIKSRKVLYPFESLQSILLYNYNNIKKNAELVFINEGVLDCIRTILNGFPPVGIFSSYLSEYQALLLAEKDIKEICLMLDSDVSFKKLSKALKLLKNTCDSTISCVQLKKGDPDDIKSKTKFENIINNRKLIPYLFDNSKLL